MRRVEPALHWLLTGTLVLFAVWLMHTGSRHQHQDAHLGAERRLSAIESRLNKIEACLEMK